MGPVVVLTVTVALLGAVYVTSNAPRTYGSSTKLLISSPAAPAQLRPTSLGVKSYVELANDSGFKNDVIHEAEKSWTANEPLPTGRDFRIEVREMEEASAIEVVAEASGPATAKVLADAAARALVVKSAEFKTSSVEFVDARLRKALKRVDEELAALRAKLIEFQKDLPQDPDADQAVRVGNLTDQIAAKARQRADMATALPEEIEPVDAELARLREALARLEGKPQTKGLDPKRTNEVAKILDEIEAQENVRRTLTNYVAQATLNDLFADEVIKIAYSAELPKNPTSPSWHRSLGVAGLAGLLVAIVLLALADPFYRTGVARPRTPENEQAYE